MNADARVRHALAHALASTLLAAVIAWAATGLTPAHAIDWADRLAAPLEDPLLARPPRLDLGTVLPGDAQALPCSREAPDGSSETPATAARPLTLAEAVETALCHHPEVQSAWAGIQLQAAQVGEARAAYLPTLTMGMSRLRQRTQYPESRFQVNSAQTSVSRYTMLTWRLLDFGGRSANRRSADALLEAALASHDAALQKTMAAVIGAYFDAQTAQASRQAKAQGQMLALQTLETARKREARGAGAQSDTLQARTALAKAEMESSRAEGDYEKSMALVVLALGWPAQSPQAQHLVLAPDDADADSGATPGQDLAAWLALASDQHPALVAARAQLVSAREKVGSVRSEGLPTLDFTQSRYVNGRPNQGLSATSTTESVVGLTLNIPLFEGFGRTYKLRGAEAQIDIRQAELRDIENKVLAEVVKGHAEAVAAWRNLASSRRLLEAAQASLDNVRLKYDRGVVDILEMLSVQMALADAGQERVRSLSEWRSARLRLLTSAGMMGTRDLRAGH